MKVKIVEGKDVKYRKFRWGRRILDVEVLKRKITVCTVYVCMVCHVYDILSFEYSLAFGLNRCNVVCRHGVKCPYRPYT